MAQFIIRFLFVALLFGSVDAAIDAVHIDIEHNQSPVHLIHDHDKLDIDADSCNHYCHCTAQLGMIFTYASHVYRSSTISKIPDFYQYQAPPLTPLFRPPIS